MKPLKVSEVNNYIKRVFAGDMILSNIEIEGEVSNFKRHFSGHLYFSLKDDKGKIKCIMFRSNVNKSLENLNEGENIIAKGYISIYEKSGEYQLYIKDIVKKGVGELYQKYEMLKIKLEKEGLFHEKYKKEIPNMPKKIGVVTSSTGAAIRDIITVINRRHPSCNILIYPSLVQGERAPGEIIRGLRYLDSIDDIDLIIVGRGGGSIDELFAFNDEELARVIFTLNKPIVSAVGHETDFTICDFVSDLRAATPSAAAELAVPDINHLKSNLDDLYDYMINSFSNYMENKSMEMDSFKRELKYNNPLHRLKEKRQDIDILLKDIVYKMGNYISKKSYNLFEIHKKIEVLNPSLSLDKGHGILINKIGNRIKSLEDLSIGEDIFIQMKDGKVLAEIKEITKGDILNGD